MRITIKKCMLISIITMIILARESHSCSKLVHIAKAERSDENGLKCTDNVKVYLCGGECDSSEISDWKFPYKKSHHPVCVYGTRHSLLVRLRFCDPGVAPGTELFHYVTASDCRCKICSSQKTNCEWLPPNSTLLEGLQKSDIETSTIFD